MKIAVAFLVTLFICGCVAPPVNEKKKKDKDKEHEPTNDVDQQVFDVEYKRYLQEVVNVLEGDDDFRQRLLKADPEDIKSGKISKELEFVNHNVRTKLDELKRQELERLRHIAIQQYEMSNGIDKRHMKIPTHIDPKNPHTFEAEDLRKLIVQTTKELEDVDRQRKDEFKEYEMQKELQYQEQLKHLDETNRKAAETQHQQMMEKHKEHQPLHHPGSKQQLEQVWEEQDRMSPEDFNPKTFFHLHDLDGNGVWDANEVKALFKKELDKMYDPNAPEDDIRERFEEMERMREHVFNETDTNKDQLISFQEFLEQTKKQDFERDEGWDPLDQRETYSQDEYRQYASQHEEEIRKMIDQGLIPPAPPGYVPMIIPPDQQHHQPQHHQGHPQSGYHVPPGMHPNGIPQQHPDMHQQGQGYHPQGGPGQPMQYHGQPPQQHQQPPPQHHQQQQQMQFHQQQQQQQQMQFQQQQQQPSHQFQQQQFHPNPNAIPQHGQPQLHPNAIPQHPNSIPQHGQPQQPPVQYHTNAQAATSQQINQQGQYQQVPVQQNFHQVNTNQVPNPSISNQANAVPVADTHVNTAPLSSINANADHQIANAVSGLTQQHPPAGGDVPAAVPQQQQATH